MLEVSNRRCNKNLTRAMNQLRDVKEQLKYEQRLHANERRTLMESKMMIERLKGEVEMPPGTDNENVSEVPSLTVGSLTVVPQRK